MDFKPLISPKRVFCDKKTHSDFFGRFYAEPFERGFGHTIGNSLRRLLLSSIRGASVISARFQDVEHEFSTIPGVKEEIPEIVLNLKGMNIKLLSAVNNTTIYIDEKGPKVVTAGDFEIPPDTVMILNPEQPIATLMEGAHLEMEVNISQGRGYIPASEMKTEDDDIGLILIDAAYSPVRHVNYWVEAARVGQRTDYDRLVIEITTNGTVKPEEALSYAGSILKQHLDMFITVEDEQRQVEEFEEKKEEVSPLAELQAKLDKSIEELELSVRSFNCLEAAGIKTIRDLVQKTEAEMLKYKNFGRKSLSEIKNILKEMSLSFNMKLDERGLPVSLTEDKFKQQ